MSTHTNNEQGDDIKILLEIKEAEIEAESILNKARSEKEAIIHDAVVLASKNFSKQSENIKANQELKISRSREEFKIIKQEKIADGKQQAKTLSTKASKKAKDACEFILRKFEEMLNV